MDALAIGGIVAGHFVLGYALGASATGPIASAGGIGLVVAGAVVLAAVGALGWMLLRRSRRRAGDERASIGDWADAACPACLAVSIVPFRHDRASGGRDWSASCSHPVAHHQEERDASC